MLIDILKYFGLINFIFFLGFIVRWLDRKRRYIGGALNKKYESEEFVILILAVICVMIIFIGELICVVVKEVAQGHFGGLGIALVLMFVEYFVIRCLRKRRQIWKQD